VRPWRASPSGRRSHQLVLLLPPLGSPMAPPSLCCPSRTAGSPEPKL
jgi:hypothetical protein